MVKESNKCWHCNSAFSSEYCSLIEINCIKYPSIRFLTREPRLGPISGFLAGAAAAPSSARTTREGRATETPAKKKDKLVHHLNISFAKRSKSGFPMPGPNAIIISY